VPPFSLNLLSRVAEVSAELLRAMNAQGDELAPAALAIARVEYPSLDPQPYFAALDRMGEEAAARIGTVSRAPQEESVRALNEYLYDEQGFAGNRERYDDPRNSFLNEVLNRRTGIPISLAVIYLEVARRAGLRVDGVNFPGHFLLRAREIRTGDTGTDIVIIDPFHGGAQLSEHDCRQLLRQHVGDEAAFDSTLLAPATRHDIVVRMLVNLKRLYVRMRSFPQARFISSLLLSVDPSAIPELRDRGLLAYHLQDFSGALRDLEEYLRLVPKSPNPGESDLIAERDDGETEGVQEPDDATLIWEHVKTLRKRVAGFN
jgi:regulator of sirC expression with transglutaminase-like and TPR domain